MVLFAPESAASAGQTGRLARPDFSRIFDVVDFKSLDINDQLNYDFRMETWRDIELQRQYAREQGGEEGMENARMTIAANLLRIGTPVETVSTVTGLSTNDVLKISF